MRFLIALLATYGSLSFAVSHSYTFIYSQFRTPLIAHESGKEEQAYQAALEQFEKTFDDNFRQNYLEKIKTDFASNVKKVYDVSLRVSSPSIHGVRLPDESLTIGYYAGADVHVTVELDEEDEALIKKVKARNLSGSAFTVPQDSKEAAAVYTQALESYRQACENWQASQLKYYSQSKTDVAIEADGCRRAPKPQMYVAKRIDRAADQRRGSGAGID